MQNQKQANERVRHHPTAFRGLRGKKKSQIKKLAIFPPKGGPRRETCHRVKWIKHIRKLAAVTRPEFPVFGAPRGLTLCWRLHDIDPAAGSDRPQLAADSRCPSMNVVSPQVPEKNAAKSGRSPFSGPQGDLKFGNKITVNTREGF